MSLVTYDLESFIEGFLEGGGLFAIIIVATVLFAGQAAFTYLIWQKNQDKTQFLKFISFSTAAGAGLFGAIALFQYMLEISEPVFNFCTIFALILIVIAVGIPIYIFIRDTWISQEKGTVKEEKA